MNEVLAGEIGRVLRALTNDPGQTDQMCRQLRLLLAPRSRRLTRKVREERNETVVESLLDAGDMLHLIYCALRRITEQRLEATELCEYLRRAVLLDGETSFVAYAEGSQTGFLPTPNEIDEHCAFTTF